MTTRTMGFPLVFSATGRTRQPDVSAWVNELIEMLLFTIPGERVMRPDLGTPVMGLVFEGLGDALAATIQVSLQAALQQWLADLVEVRDVTVDSADSTLLITVAYAVAGETSVHRIEFKRERG